MKASDYRGQLRNHILENQIKGYLRSIEEAERLAFIKEMVSVQVLVAIDLARSCLREKSSIREFFRIGLSRGHVSELELWLSLVVTRYSFQELLRFLRAEIGSHPEAVEKSLYWLPSLADGHTHSALDEFLGHCREQGISN